MGIDDRDYMRERYRHRVNPTRWNEGRGRIEAAWLDPRHQRHRRQPSAAAIAVRFALPVPAGTYRVRLIEGRKWHGAKRYFGANTSYETVAKLIEFTPARGHIIDLHRRPRGNLETRMMGSR